MYKTNPKTPTLVNRQQQVRWLMNSVLQWCLAFALLLLVLTECPRISGGRDAFVIRIRRLLEIYFWLQAGPTLAGP